MQKQAWIKGAKTANTDRFHSNPKSWGVCTALLRGVLPYRPGTLLLEATQAPPFTMRYNSRNNLKQPWLILLPPLDLLPSLKPGMAVWQCLVS